MSISHTKWDVLVKIWLCFCTIVVIYKWWYDLWIRGLDIVRTLHLFVDVVLKQPPNVGGDSQTHSSSYDWHTEKMCCCFRSYWTNICLWTLTGPVTVCSRCRSRPITRWITLAVIGWELDRKRINAAGTRLFEAKKTQQLLLTYRSQSNVCFWIKKKVRKLNKS